MWAYAHGYWEVSPSEITYKRSQYSINYRVGYECLIFIYSWVPSIYNSLQVLWSDCCNALLTLYVATTWLKLIWILFVMEVFANLYLVCIWTEQLVRVCLSIYLNLHVQIYFVLISIMSWFIFLECWWTLFAVGYDAQ